jgi:putative serine protease PepD
MKNMSRWIPVIGGAVAGAVVALVIAGTSSSTTHSVTTTTVLQQGTGAAEPTSLASSGGLTVNQIYHKDSAGVVDIIVTEQTQTPSFGFGFFGGSGNGGTETEEGEGAGVVYNTSGDILTDEHVVANETSVKVNFQDGKSYPATVVGTDPSTDVAVIHVDAPASELHPIPLANSADAQVGDPVVAIGSPFSEPETVTAGIVSQTGRSIQAPNGYTIPDAIQTDAAINPGNSGGPLLTADGEVLGLNDQIETDNTTAGGEGSSSGVGFAIASDTVAEIANQLIAGHKVEHAYVGVDLDGDSSGGAEINTVQAGSPASAAGLKADDLITAINGQPITTTDQFIAAIDGEQPGQTVTLTVHRQGQVLSIKVTLAVRSGTAPSAG